MILKNKKSPRPYKTYIDQDELWFMFDLGKFLRDIADELRDIPNDVLDEYGASMLQSDPLYVYDYGAELEDIARRLIAKEHNKEKKRRKKQKKLERERAMKLTKDVQTEYFLQGLESIKRECEDMKELYDKDIDRPECDLAWLKAYDRWIKWSKLAKEDKIEHDITPPPEPSFPWNSVFELGAS